MEEKCNCYSYRRHFLYFYRGYGRKRITNINDPAGLRVVFANPMQYSGYLHKEVIKVTWCVSHMSPKMMIEIELFPLLALISPLKRCVVLKTIHFQVCFALSFRWFSISFLGKKLGQFSGKNPAWFVGWAWSWTIMGIFMFCSRYIFRAWNIWCTPHPIFRDLEIHLQYFHRSRRGFLEVADRVLDPMSPEFMWQLSRCNVFEVRKNDGSFQISQNRKMFAVLVFCLFGWIWAQLVHTWKIQVYMYIYIYIYLNI